MRWPIHDQIPPADVLRRVIENEPLPRNLGSFLSQCAARSHDRPLWRFLAAPAGSPFATLTYGQLDELVSKLAAGLLALGVRKGSHVAILLPNIPAYPISWLALARIGAIAIPMNVRYVAREVEYVLSDSRAEWLIRDASSDELFAAVNCIIDERRIIRHGPNCVRCTDWNAVINASAAACEVFTQPGPEDIVTIQYTSGTTGFPKGVLLSHRYWLTFMQAGTMETRYVGIERMLLAHPFYYMAGTGWLLFGLRLGVTLFIAPGLSIANFVPWLRETRAQYTLITSAVLNHQLAQPREHLGLEFLHVGSAFSQTKHEEMERTMGCPIRNSYGMTEVGISAYVPIRAEQHVSADCIGITAPNRDLIIADSSGKPVADGETGEICVRGPGILQGYFNKPEAHAASFFGDYHRSGDRAYRDADGFIHLLGRMKDVIRKNNENISAIEVETVVLGMPGVQRVAAVPVPDERSTEEIKLYIQLAPGYTQDTITPASIYTHCEANLARFKLPRYLAYHSSMPTTMSDKVDKRHLILEKQDLRLGTYDFAEGRWR